VSRSVPRSAGQAGTTAIPSSRYDGCGLGTRIESVHPRPDNAARLSASDVEPSRIGPRSQCAGSRLSAARPCSARTAPHVGVPAKSWIDAATPIAPSSADFRRESPRRRCHAVRVGSGDPGQFCSSPERTNVRYRTDRTRYAVQTISRFRRALPRRAVPSGVLSLSGNRTEKRSIPCSIRLRLFCSFCGFSVS